MISEFLLADVSTGVQHASRRIIGKVLQQNRHVIRRKKVSRALRPFDEHQRVRREDLVPTEVRELVGTAEPVQIEVVNRRSRTGKFVHERECGAGYLVMHTVPAADRARERRLAGPQVAAQGHNERRASGPTEPLAPVHELGLGNGEMTSRREWRDRLGMTFHKREGFQRLAREPLTAVCAFFADAAPCARTSNS